MIHDFVDDDFVTKREHVRPASGALTRIQPTAGAIRRAATMPVLYHGSVGHRLVIGRVKEQPVLVQRAKPELRVGQGEKPARAQLTSRWEDVRAIGITRTVAKQNVTIQWNRV